MMWCVENPTLNVILGNIDYKFVIQLAYMMAHVCSYLLPSHELICDPVLYWLIISWFFVGMYELGKIMH